MDKIKDTRPELTLLIGRQKLIKASAEAEIKRLEQEFSDVEKSLPLVWLIVCNSDPNNHFGATRSRFDTTQIWTSSNNYMEAFHVEEISIDEANRRGIKFID